MPGRAIKLPVQLVQEAFNSPGSRRGERIESLQRDLNQQVTGHEPAYSEGRRWASALSLGLVPNNHVPSVNPTELNPEQAQRFGELTPLQQRLLQSSRPRDFAEMLNDPTLWGEEKPHEYENVPQGAAVFDKSTGEVAMEPYAPPKVLPPGNEMRDASGELLGRNEFEPQSLTDSRGAAADKARADADLAKQKIEQSKSEIGKLDAEADKLRSEAEKNRKGPEAPTGASLKDRNAIQTMEGRVSTRTLARGKDLERGFTAARNFWQLYELRGSDQTPPSYIADLNAMGFKDLGRREPRSVQDLALMTMGVRMADPPGRITDKDVDMYSRARAYFDPGIVEAVAKGQVLTNAQRNELAIGTRKLSTGLLQSNDAAVVDGRKEALRDRVSGSGVGMNPMNIPDQAADLRISLFGKELGDQAAYPLADPETEQLLDQLWQTAYPGRQPTPQEAIQWANTHGFRVQEIGQ